LLAESQLFFDLFQHFYRNFIELSKDFSITFRIFSAARWASDVEVGGSGAALILAKAIVRRNRN
jgi:hypothetical protein